MPVLSELLRSSEVEVRGRSNTCFRAAAVLNFLTPFLAAFVFLASTISTHGQGDQTGSIPSRPDGELIHYGDVIEVDVVGSLDFDWRGGLTPEGFLDGLERAEMPVYALCRTESEVAASITERYRKILRDPNVAVRIIDRSNRALAYVNGAVKSAQRFQLRRPVTLTELLVLSGGITDTSNGEISVFRPPYVNCRRDQSAEPSFENAATQTPKRFSIKIADLLNGDRSVDIPILSGDIVTVVEAAPIFVMIDSGAPRRLNLTPELNLSRAIAAAGGQARDLETKKIRIYRRNSSSGPLEIDMKRVLETKSEPPALAPFDVIVVQKKGSDESRIAGFPESAGPETGRLAKLPLRIVD